MVGRVPLGALVDAKIRYEWDRRRKEQVESVHSTIEERITKSKADAVAYLTSIIQAHCKINGEKLALFLQTGNSSLVDVDALANFKLFKEAASLLNVLTGGKMSTSADEAKVNVGGNIQQTNVYLGESKKRLDSASADKLLALLDGEIING
jgi:hypothetical protein